jgi:hypothetical protein
MAIANTPSLNISSLVSDFLSVILKSCFSLSLIRVLLNLTVGLLREDNQCGIENSQFMSDP